MRSLGTGHDRVVKDGAYRGRIMWAQEGKMGEEKDAKLFQMMFFSVVPFGNCLFGVLNLMQTFWECLCVRKLTRL